MGDAARQELSERDIEAEAKLARVAWRAPPGWIAPAWLPPEAEPPSLPMTSDRLRWVMSAIGWSWQEIARRIRTHVSSVRQMGGGWRGIPDTLAIWLEETGARTLAGPGEHDGWRPKPVETAS
jgi:hypothetical protein